MKSSTACLHSAPNTSSGGSSGIWVNPLIEDDFSSKGVMSVSELVKVGGFPNPS